MTFEDAPTELLLIQMICDVDDETTSAEEALIFKGIVHVEEDGSVVSANINELTYELYDLVGDIISSEIKRAGVNLDAAEKKLVYNVGVRSAQSVYENIVQEIELNTKEIKSPFIDKSTLSDTTTFSTDRSEELEKAKKKAQQAKAIADSESSDSSKHLTEQDSKELIYEMFKENQIPEAFLDGFAKSNAAGTKVSPQDMIDAFNFAAGITDNIQVNTITNIFLEPLTDNDGIIKTTKSNTYDGSIPEELVEQLFSETEILELEEKSREQLLSTEFNILEAMAILIESMNNPDLDFEEFDEYKFLQELELFTPPSGNVQFIYTELESTYEESDNKLGFTVEFSHADITVSKVELVYTNSADESVSALLELDQNKLNNTVSTYELNAEDSGITDIKAGTASIKIYNDSEAVVANETIDVYTIHQLIPSDFSQYVTGDLEKVPTGATPNRIFNDHFDKSIISWPHQQLSAEELTAIGLHSSFDHSIEYDIFIFNRTTSQYVCDDYENFSTNDNLLYFEDIKAFYEEQGCSDLDMSLVSYNMEFELTIDTYFDSEMFSKDIAKAQIPFTVQVTDLPDLPIKDLNAHIDDPTFTYVLDVKISSDGTIYALLSDNHILKLDSAGNLIQKIDLSSTSSGACYPLPWNVSNKR